MKKSKKLITSLVLSALMAVQPIACYADSAPWDESGETFSHTFEVRVVEAYKNDAFIGGLEARLVEYKFDYDDKHHAGDYIRTIAEFTTSDTEPTYITCDDVNTSCVYVLEIDELPENHSYFGTASVAKYHGGYDLANPPYNPYIIYLQNQPPYEVWEDFPITKTVDWTVAFDDYTSVTLSDREVEYIKGIDFEIAKMTPDGNGGFTPVETLGNWNTSETDIITFTTEETFSSEDDKIYFGFKFNAVPEEYEEAFSGLSKNFYDGYYVYNKYGYSVRTRDTGFYFTWRKTGDEIITTAPTTTKPHTTTTTTTVAPDGKVLGDSNGDGELSLADAVLIMQSLANPAEYVITPECAELADVVDRGDGLTPMDALAIQMINIELLNAGDLPVTSEQLNKL